jgi:phosphatidylglycerophosphatase A
MTENNKITPEELRKAFFRHPVHWLALGFGSGLTPKAPGTAGTVIAIPLVYLTAAQSFSVRLLILAILIIAGIWICDKSAKLLGVHDHGSIVWDEIAGFYMTMVFLPFSLLSLLLGFAAFRLFDILKPWPIKQLDAHVQGGLGIMLDDLVAAVFAGGLILLCNIFLIHYTNISL